MSSSNSNVNTKLDFDESDSKPVSVYLGSLKMFFKETSPNATVERKNRLSNLLLSMIQMNLGCGEEDGGENRDPRDTIHEELTELLEKRHGLQDHISDIATACSASSQAPPIAVVVAMPDPTTVKVNSVKNWLASFSASSSIGTTSSSSPAPHPRRGNLRSLPKRSYEEKTDEDNRDSGDDEYDVAIDDPQPKKRRKEMEREARKLQKEAEKKEKEFQKNMFLKK
ncbi:unnamed protein product [Caenorhabditis nigoni]